VRCELLFYRGAAYRGWNGTSEENSMTTSVASVDPWPLPPPEAITRLDPPVSTPNGLARRTAPVRSIRGLLDDAGLLLLIAVLFPVAILLIGMPVALLVGLVSAIVQRL
jgi:hypothetical protein